MPIIRTNYENKVMKEFFVDYTNITDVCKKLHPNAFTSKNNKHIPKLKTLGSVSNVFKKLKDAGYIEEQTKLKQKVNKKGTKYSQPITAYRLNLNFFFDFANKKLPLNQKLTKKEKKILNYLCSFQNIRKSICRNEDENLIVGIKRVLLKTVIKSPSALSLLEHLAYWDQIFKKSGFKIPIAKNLSDKIFIITNLNINKKQLERLFKQNRNTHDTSLILGNMDF